MGSYIYYKGNVISDIGNMVLHKLLVCIIGGGAGVDSVWEQRKLETRNMLVNRADSHTSDAPKKMEDHHLFMRENVALFRQKV
jgi:hypothetical protein